METMAGIEALTTIYMHTFSHNFMPITEFVDDVLKGDS
jgi:hypothetical protein